MTPEDDVEFQSDLRDYEVFATERKILISAEGKHSASFDKYLLTFSAGTFGLTITFIKEMVSTIKDDTKWILIAAWSTLIGTILIVLITFLTSQAAYRRQIEIDQDLLVTHRGEASNRRNTWSAITIAANILAIAGFVVGILMLMIFVAKNL